MQKQLFFDDSKLFGKTNTERKYGSPELIEDAVYSDGVSSTDFCTSSVFRLENGNYRLLYFAHGKDFEGKKLFSAISEDGIHFSPEKLCEDLENSDKDYFHEVMTLPPHSEVGCIYEDKTAPLNERYKILMSEFSPERLEVDNTIYVSDDLLNWKRKENCFWGHGPEPLVSVFYNKKKDCHTIVERPFWGIRNVGYTETKDWIQFSDYKYCMTSDCLDEDLAEVYGMHAFSYNGMYIGITQMYRNLKNEYSAKYKNGTIDTQLSYSYDGEYWQRSLRVPFLSGLNPKHTPNGKTYNMLWVPFMLQNDDGSINFYASASEYEHGNFETPGTGKIFVYSLRKDGFISLASKNPNEESCIITREKIWHGGEVHINIKAKKATAAVFVSNEAEILATNALGTAYPVEGYTHNDCIPFEGDSTDWVPKFKNGKTLDDLKGKTVVIEIKFTDGELYSFSGNYTDVFNTEAVRYRKFGTMPRW